MIGDEVLDLPIVELSRRLHEGVLRAIDLADAYLARIDRVAPALNCFVTVTAERARTDARRADADLAAGKRGPLIGIPYVLKDLIDTAGIRTTWGTRALVDRIPTKDADVEARLRASGAVLLGKASMTELANAFAGDYPEDNHGGACRNPWDRTRWVGGSSGGSACAVAAGLCGFAIGSETWGSIDHPSSWCGVSGYRPTYDRVSRAGTMTLSWSLDKIGAIARDARDLAMVASVIATNPPADLEVPTDLPMRIGVLDAMQDPDPDPANATTWAAAKATLMRSGLTLVPIEVPEFPRVPAMLTILRSDIFVALEPFIRAGHAEQRYDRQPWSAKVADFEAAGFRSTDYIKAMQVRTLIQQTYQRLFETVDVIVCFGTADLPFVLGGTWPADPKKHAGRATLLTDGNLAGLPGITVPIGFTESGLPRSMHAAAAPYHDEALLAFGARFQLHDRSHQRRPPAT